ncbi:hypothetical protein YC2023_089712 [Brassica napus]
MVTSPIIFSDSDVGRVLQQWLQGVSVIERHATSRTGKAYGVDMLLLDEKVCSLSFLCRSLCILRCSPYLTWHRCSCLCLFTRHFSKVHNCPSRSFDVTRSNNLFDSLTSLSQICWRSVPSPLHLFWVRAECSKSFTKYGGVKKLESLTVSELNAYVVNSPPHIMFLATCVSYMCSDGEKLFATHTNTTCGAGPVIHSPPLDETTTAAQATVGGSSVTEPPVAMME